MPWGILSLRIFQGKVAKGKMTTKEVYIALRKLRQGDCEFKASLDYTVKLCQKNREG